MSGATSLARCSPSITTDTVPERSRKRRSSFSPSSITRPPAGTSSTSDPASSAAVSASGRSARNANARRSSSVGRRPGTGRSYNDDGGTLEARQRDHDLRVIPTGLVPLEQDLDVHLRLLYEQPKSFGTFRQRQRAEPFERGRASSQDRQRVLEVCARVGVMA